MSDLIIGPGPKVIKLVSCSIQLSMKFRLLINFEKVRTRRSLESYTILVISKMAAMPIYGNQSQVAQEKSTVFQNKKYRNDPKFLAR